MGQVTRVNPRAGKAYYGWVVVAASFVIWTVVFGIQYSFGIFLKPLQDDLGWSRATTSWTMTFHLLVFALCMVPASRAIERFKIRPVFSFAAVLIGLSLVLCSRISEPWQLYLLYGVPLGAGISICGPNVPTIVTGWFNRRRGLALGIVSCGVGFGTLAAAPLTNWLIGSYGWRSAFITLGLASSILVLVATYFVKSSPQPDRNLQPHEKASPPTMTVGKAIKTRSLLLIMVAAISSSLATRMVLVHMAPYAMDIGISSAMAALAVSAVGASSIVGRLAMGSVQDRIGPQRSMVICLTALGISMLALPFIRSDLAFFVYAVVFGLSYGGDVPQIPAITAQTFGVALMGLTYSLVMTGANITGSIGPTAAGYIFDLSGSYNLSFLIVAAVAFTGAFSISRLRTPSPEAAER